MSLSPSSTAWNSPWKCCFWGMGEHHKEHEGGDLLLKEVEININCSPSMKIEAGSNLEAFSIPALSSVTKLCSIWRCVPSDIVFSTLPTDLVAYGLGGDTVCLPSNLFIIYTSIPSVLANVKPMILFAHIQNEETRQVLGQTKGHSFYLEYNF